MAPDTAASVDDVPGASDVVVAALPDGMVIDYITGTPVTSTPKEQVRQHVARALAHEYEISADDMARDFPIAVTVDGRSRRRRRADIAVFAPGAEHTTDHLRRVVVCRPEPKNGNTVTRIRTPEQAERDLSDLRELLGDERTPELRYGMWTNRIELFFLEKTVERFGARFRSVAGWPLRSEHGSRSVVSHARLRRADSGMLRAAFRRCHNYIHGNEGMPKDAAFWQFLYLLFAKIFDERAAARGDEARFFAGMEEPFNPDGQRAIASRVRALFADVKDEFPLFTARDELAMSDRALAFLVGELAPYDLGDSDIDAKGLAYQELVGSNLRGDRGQYFTPRVAVDFMVEILDPGEGERVLDPASGTGGFLRSTLRHLLNQWRATDGADGKLTAEQQGEHRARLTRFARERLFGADFDPFLVRATSMNLMLLAGIEGNVFHLDSLSFPNGHLDGVAGAAKRIRLGTVDVLITNPPFGADIRITDPAVLDHYRHDGVARPWTRDRATGELGVSTASQGVTTMAPEQLFIQRSVEWLRPGGRLGIVLPNGILSNPGPADEGIRSWILDNCWVLASVELPMQTFVAEAGVNIITSMLFLKRKTAAERRETHLGASGDYPIFMAIAEQVGFDRRNQPVYRRTPDGEIVTVEQLAEEWVRTNGNQVRRTLHRRTKVIDNDLPEIAEQYREFRRRYPEPGMDRQVKP